MVTIDKERKTRSQCLCVRALCKKLGDHGAVTQGGLRVCALRVPKPELSSPIVAAQNKLFPLPAPQHDPLAA